MTVLRKGQRDRAVTLLAALPLEKSKTMRAATRQLQHLAETNDGCLTELASALCQRARNTSVEPNLAKALNRAAKTLLENQNSREAVKLLNLLLELVPDEPQALYRLAKALAALGERSRAVTILQSLLVANPARVPAANLLARLVQPNEIAAIATEIAPLSVAHADAEPTSTAECIQVLVRLMCFDEAADLLTRLTSVGDPAIAKAAFDIGISTNDAALASRALGERNWLPGEEYEKDVWLSQLALMTSDRQSLSAPFERLRTAGKLDLLGSLLRPMAQALGRYEDAFSANWSWARRLHTGSLLSNLFQPNESLESLTGAKVLIIAYVELGDEIYPLELVDRIRERVASCTIVVDRRIAGLVARNREDLNVFGTEKIAPAPLDSPVPDTLRRHVCPEVWSQIDQYDKVLLINDLHALLVRSEGDLPRRQKTLDALPELRAKWRKELEQLGHGPRIGLFWRSGRVNYRRSAKFTHLNDWLPVLTACGGRFVSLQFGPGVSEEIAALGEGVLVHEIPGLNTRDDLESVAGLMCELDLIVTVPGTTMHLAGALGTRTLGVSHPSEALRRARLDGKTGLYSPSVEMVSGPAELGFDGAIAAAARRLKTLFPGR